MADVKGIVRIAKKDIDGHKELSEAFQEVKGIGSSLANSLAHKVAEETEADKKAKIGSLEKEELKKAKEILNQPEEYGIPSHLLNRRKDRQTGEHKHLTEADLDLKQKRDIEHMKEIKSYKGIRHKYGLRVRGQKTRTTGRSETTLGVEKEKMKPEEK